MCGIEKSLNSSKKCFRVNNRLRLQIYACNEVLLLTEKKKPSIIEQLDSKSFGVRFCCVVLLAVFFSYIFFKTLEIQIVSRSN